MSFLLNSYGSILKISSPALQILLKRRLKQGKEDKSRLGERQGKAGRMRPPGHLIWVHGASVGEAQSTLVIIHHLRQRFPSTTILLTTGTVSSARYVKDRLPEGTIHQYYPLDHPDWVSRFLSHWQPDMALWMESELWPSMLRGLKKRSVPTLLVNARMSKRSLMRWKHVPQTSQMLLQTFSTILAQTEQDAQAYRTLGAENVIVSGNLKYAADALPVDQSALDDLKTATQGRPLWLYASTHKGEEELACRLHQKLEANTPGLLTVIVPRHPERREQIRSSCHLHGLKTQLRTEAKILPEKDTEIYIADTLGELGLFYRLAPVACIGRSFSDDGGGGHNPIEAAQLGCAVLHGPHVQNLADIYRDMDNAGAALAMDNENDFTHTLMSLLTTPHQAQALARAGLDFAHKQQTVLDRIMGHILPVVTSTLSTTRARHDI